MQTSEINICTSNSLKKHICTSKPVFYFYIFYFRFLQKYIFDLKIYMNIPRPPRCRAAGAFLKKISRRKLRAGPWGPVARQRGGQHPPGRPAAGRPALAARLQGDRLSHPYIRVCWSPPPLICITKIPETKKKREGGREAKPCRIFEPATAGNQNSSTLYK